MANQIFLKLSQPLSSVQSPSASPPNKFFNMILLQLNEWLAIIPNLFHSLLAKFDELFPPETREHLFAVAKPFVIAGFAFVVLCLFCCCCLPAIISCIFWVVAACWGLLSGLFKLLWRMCSKIFSICCCCSKRSLKMMKAPGRGGGVLISRAVFESNPGSYFINLRAGRPV